MKQKTKTTIEYIINIFSFLILGIMLLIGPNITLGLFHIITSLSLIIIGLLLTIKNIIKFKKINNIFISLVLILIGIFFYADKYRLLVIFPVAFSFYIILISLIKLSTFIIYKRGNYKGFYVLFFTIIIDFVFALLIINHPVNSIAYLTIVMGIYLIFISIQYMMDFFYVYHTYNNKNRQFRWTVPKILTVFLPFNIAEAINKNLNEPVTEVKMTNKKVSGKVDMEVLIAVKNSNIGKFGHGEIVFDNLVYSYGSYDEESKRFFGTVGDGTIFTVEKEKYLDFCTRHSGKTFFSFGITLTDNQKERVKKRLKQIMDDTYRWMPPSEVDPKGDFQDYGSCLYRETKATFYKFDDKNKYRLYYALWNNCVKLIDDILGSTGSSLLALNGVITPGTYYYFLDDKFRTPNSNIIRKQIIVNGDTFTQKKK